MLHVMECMTVLCLLAEWHEALEREVNESAAAYHTHHIYALTKLADLCLREMEPISRSFVPPDAAAFKDSGGEIALTPLQEYFWDEIPSITALRDDVASMTSDLMTIKQNSDTLSSLVSALQNSMMNSVLFVLTGITTAFTPLTLLSGYYGMNFQFEELDSNLGVGAFWVPAAVFFAIAVLVYWRFGFWRVL